MGNALQTGNDGDDARPVKKPEKSTKTGDIQGIQLNTNYPRNISGGNISGEGFTYTIPGNVYNINIQDTNELRDTLDKIKGVHERKESRGSTTYLMISRYKDNYNVTATHIPSEPVFRPSFPTGFMTIDEDFVKRAMINKFENSFSDSSDFKSLGAILYNYFIPWNIRDYISKLPPDNLVIQTMTEHDIPWEFTYDGEDFWCMKYNLGRALSTEDLRTGDDQFSEVGSAIKIAIISNPEGNLDEATKEAESIKSILEKKEQKENKENISIDIIDKKEATKLRVLSIITSGNYDVIHYTGHAEFNSAFSEEPGILNLSDSPLTTNEIIRLRFQSSRPIIFANGCSTSATRFVGDKTVGLATAFVVAGALAYVGTMWPIKDEQAAKFAADFYRQLTTKTIGEALKQSRMNIRSIQRQAWAPYSLYGDPKGMLHISNQNVEPRVIGM